MINDSSLLPLERFSTGVDGLDRVLGGGFFTGGVYLVEGVPGAGKTILANQICFDHVSDRRGPTKHRALYVTLLAESHARLLQHLQSMEFFDVSAIPERLTYVSGFRVLESEGLKGLVDLIRRELRAQRATMVVLDGFAAVGESTESDREFKKLVHELQVHATLARCTFFLLSSGVSTVVHPVHTMVDGLVRLTERFLGSRSERDLTVQKFRGSDFLRGEHSFSISDVGVHVYPRLEAVTQAPATTVREGRMPFGVPSLDRMVGGGLSFDTTTMLLGPSGVGKTTLGYKFLEQSSAEAPGLAFSFYEDRERALIKARAIAVDLEGPMTRGHLQFLWQAPMEISLDQIGERLLAAVERHKVSRLFIDGFNALLVASGTPHRVPQFFSALAEQLRIRNVTTLYSAELSGIFTRRVVLPADGISPLLENLILLRFMESGTEVHRTLAVVKMRASAYDPTLRRFEIGADGLQVDDDPVDASAILTGTPRRRRAGREGGAERSTRTRSR